jgi:hypothetical protein
VNARSDFEYFLEVLALNPGVIRPPDMTGALNLSAIIPGYASVDPNTSPWVTPPDIASLYQALTNVAILLLGSNPPATIVPDTAWYYLPERSVYIQGINPLARVGLNRAIKLIDGLLRAKICDVAEKHLGTQGNKFQQKYYDEAIDGNAPTGPAGIHWCGIFACWIWRQVGMNVKWVLRLGIKHLGNNTAFNATKSSTAWKMLSPGDILVHDGVQPNGANHHMIVVAVAADGSEVDVLEGNAGDPDPNKSVVKLTQGKKIRDLIDPYYFSVDTYRDMAVRYN